MAILPGRRLGPYEILSSIGAGGMGEVYRARDTRLNRIVAIKVLPPHLADRSESRERFEREARTIASLNHAHICTLHDIGQQDGIDYLVMEYLEGETLAQRLIKGPLPLDLVLQFAIEISDALDKAHRKGVTHRDLKPGNIMLTKTGTKLLDFGLAKLKHEVSPANVQLSELPTASDPLTAEGSIVGTLQYMAPEQLEAKPADARTDIFAFGVVLYEMATGKKAFEGKSQASLIAAILEREPPAMSLLQPTTPPQLDRVAKACMAKDPDERWQTASDLSRELKWISDGGLQTSVPAAARIGFHGLGGRESILVLGALIILVAAIAGLAVWNLKLSPSVPRPVSRFTITLPQGQQLAVPENGPAVALSPDGTHLAYVAREGLTQQVYLRAIDSLEARPIPGTQGPVGGTNYAEPFFSPDSQWLGFFVDGKLKKVSVSGGTPLTLCDVYGSYGVSWGTRGTIAFAPGPVPVLWQVSDVGGSPVPLSHVEMGEANHGWPEFLPDGNALLFFVSTEGNWTNGQIAVQTVGTAGHRNLIPGGMYPHYAPTGHLLYVQGGTLMAVPFNPQQLAVTGTAVPIVEGVLQSTLDGDAQYSFSATGTLAYVPKAAQSTLLKLVWVNRNGAEQPLAAPARAYVIPRISPDGLRIAVGITERESQIWTYDISRRTLTRSTFQGNNNLDAIWTPDGKRIVFTSNRDGQRNLFWQLADGSGGLERLATSVSLQIPGSLSADGQFLAYGEVDARTGYDLWVLRLSDRKAQPFLQTRSNESAPQFSPDGHWLAYTSDESGRKEIYVQPYPGPGGKWQISTEGGVEPLWNRNGRELFYRNGKKMMAVEISTKASFSTGAPKTLFEGEYVLLPTISTPNYDVSPDGQRFLMLKPAEEAQVPTQINVVLNWFEELKQKVPTGKK
jgi:Tol biopolymer transport system component